ncbi:hypothetical protein [Roseococcus pinisoli]|uniref:Glycosyltransferase n=1 Tax=Roseococcus pinisoli TaxID=2835040 RepID=A0ABS5QHG9_9PROT|nr:hypothetical protein [Roseococcus pinisoli]MBS7812377.1 hypothetical protein [Roseococcus pinisoli]
MKLLFDPIYSGKPRRCSSASKYKKLTGRLLAARPDVFIYWRVPTWMDEEDRAWLPSDPRVKYIEVPCNRYDRVREYQHITPDLEDQISFNGSLWDADVVVTMRTQQVAAMRTIMGSPRQHRFTWMKGIFLLEEMLIAGFRKTVPVCHQRSQEGLSLLGHGVADGSYITANHVRAGLIDLARQEWSPSRVRELMAKVKLVSPLLFTDFEAKAPEFRYVRGQGPFRPFHVGRINAFSSRCEETFSALDKSWIMRGAGMAPEASSQSEGSKVEVPESVTLGLNEREEFHRKIKQEAHVCVNNALDAEFSMTVLEPLCFGTPVILPDAEWSRALLGNEYPFFIGGSEAKIYSAIAAFEADYDKLYAQFLEWRDTAFVERMRPGGLFGHDMYATLEADLFGFCDDMRTQVHKQWGKTGLENEVVLAILKACEGKEEMQFFDVIREIAVKGEFTTLRVNLPEAAPRAKLSLSFMTAWPIYRLQLQVLHGWEDASAEPGHMKRSKPA